jgi:hypothetical protein
MKNTGCPGSVQGCSTHHTGHAWGTIFFGIGGMKEYSRQGNSVIHCRLSNKRWYYQNPFLGYQPIAHIQSMIQAIAKRRMGFYLFLCIYIQARENVKDQEGNGWVFYHNVFFYIFYPNITNSYFA